MALPQKVTSKPCSHGACTGAGQKGKQTERLSISERAVKTTKQGNVEKTGCEGDSMGRVVKEGFLEAVI